ncbi:MAG: HNH endonuclease [Planctomycetes bacterium]|nr:HNH endonuclease [Planctomycetota bacterium]
MLATALEHPTLVLNRNWTVISVVPVRHALVLVCRDAARFISPETYETHDMSSWAAQAVGADETTIHLVSRVIRVPEVIVLTRYDRMPRREVPFTRRNLYRRDRYTCQYCGGKPGSENLSIDHVIPRSSGGPTGWSNCVLACLSCNVRKANRMPADAGLTLLRKPSRPRWVPQVTLPEGLIKKSWPQFVSDRYWEVELTD